LLLDGLVVGYKLPRHRKGPSVLAVGHAVSSFLDVLREKSLVAFCFVLVVYKLDTGQLVSVNQASLFSRDVKVVFLLLVRFIRVFQGADMHAFVPSP
jgi:hypothetical protein